MKFFPLNIYVLKVKNAEKVLNWMNTKGLNLRKGSNKITLKLWHFNLNKSKESGRIVFYSIYKTDFLSFYLIFDIILLFHWSDILISGFSLFEPVFKMLVTKVCRWLEITRNVGDNFKTLEPFLGSWCSKSSICHQHL